MKISYKTLSANSRRGYSNQECLIEFEWDKDLKEFEGQHGEQAHPLHKNGFRRGVETAMLVNLGHGRQWCHITAQEENFTKIEYGNDSGD